MNPTQDHEIVGQDTPNLLACTDGIRSCAQGGAEPPLMVLKNAIGVPALLLECVRRVAAQGAPVGRRRLLTASSAGTEGQQVVPDAQFLSAETEPADDVVGARELTGGDQSYEAPGIDSFTPLRARRKLCGGVSDVRKRRNALQPYECGPFDRVMEAIARKNKLTRLVADGLIPGCAYAARKAASAQG